MSAAPSQRLTRASRRPRTGSRAAPSRRTGGRAACWPSRRTGTRRSRTTATPRARAAGCARAATARRESRVRDRSSARRMLRDARRACGAKVTRNPAAHPLKSPGKPTAEPWGFELAPPCRFGYPRAPMRRAVAPLILALLIVACALRVAGLYDDFWLDEIWSWRIAGELARPWQVFTHPSARYDN